MAPRAGGIKSWVLAMLAAKRRLRVAPVPPHAADLTPPARGAPVMPGRDEGTAAAVEPRNNHKQAPRLAVNTICRLQSLAQWWVRLNHAPHTEIRTLPTEFCPRNSPVFGTLLDDSFPRPELVLSRAFAPPV